MRTLATISFLFLASLSFSQTPSVFIWVDTFCADQIVLVNGNFYGPGMETGTEVLPGQAFNGADSIIEVQFTFLPEPYFLISGDLCPGDTIWVGTEPYHANRFFGFETLENQAFNGCDSIVEIDLTILEQPMGEVTDTLCADSFLVYNGNRYDRENSVGTEVLEGAAASGCDSLILIDLSFREISLDLGTDQHILLGESACINADINFVPSSVSWSPAPPCPSGDCLNACFEPFAFTELLVTGEDENGCIVSDSLRVFVDTDQRLYFPNVFRPNSAESGNRVFFIGAGPGISSILELTVFNRWGEQVYFEENLSPNDPNQGWDGHFKGEKVRPGVYVFFVRLLSITGEEIERSGTVTLVE